MSNNFRMPISEGEYLIFPYNHSKDMFQYKADYDVSILQNKYSNDLLLQIAEDASKFYNEKKPQGCCYGPCQDHRMVIRDMKKYEDDINNKHFPTGDIVVRFEIRDDFRRQYLRFHLMFVYIQKGIKEAQNLKNMAAQASNQPGNNNGAFAPMPVFQPMPAGQTKF